MDLSWLNKGFQWLESVGLFTLGLSAIGFVLQKTWIHMLKIREENYKSELRKREDDFRKFLDDQKEEHKSELKKINDKYHITFSKLHVDRAEKIKDLYEKIVELELSISKLLGLGIEIEEGLSKDEVQERAIGVIRKTIALEDYYLINKIYFSEEVCNSFEDLRAYTQIIVGFFYGYYDRQEEEEKKTTKLKIEKYIKEEFPKVKKDLEVYFRRLLGVIEE
ncbi:TPA: hypothetical protein QCY24_000134 [Bacillus wiedmannii]|nr:hypothetical protein [Bacillus wiedmannii]